ncbi:MAG: 3-oxoacyl-[acyl-carrier-protein] synthase-3 [Moritella dasanensis]|jgi:3-oxoacyl-[acyl-carrier-protein] synthase-3
MQERRISHVGTSELAYVAACQAIAAAGIDASELDGIFFATCTADYTLPSAASKVQAKLGATNAAVFDMNAACTGFVYGLSTANAFIQSGQMDKVLVIGAERISYFLDWTERGTAVLFGDGAGTVIIESSTEKQGILSNKIGCDGDAGHILSVPNFGTNRARFKNVDGLFDFNFEGKEIFKRTVTRMGEASTIALEKAQMTPADIDFIIPHQANLRIIDFLAKRMGASKEKVMVNVDKYGNTSSATVPIALCEALEEGRINAGDNVLLAAFGGGLTWGATVIKWGQRTTPIATSDVTLPEYNALH